MKLSNIVFIATLITLITSISGCKGQSANQVIRIGHTLDTKHSVHLALVHMAEKLAEYSNGEMSIKLYPNGQLGSEREMVELLQIGSLAMTKVSAATLEGFVDDMKVFGLPYVFVSTDHRWQVLDSDIGHDILASVQSSHLVGLGYMDAGSRSFYTCENQVTEPKDIIGKKIRVMSSQNAVNMVTAFGGAATPMSWGELYAALQQKVVDGAENNLPSYYSSRHYEVCKNFSLNEHTAIPDVVVASEHVFNSLNTQQQTWLRMAMNDAVIMQKKLWLQAENEALAEIKKAGVTVITPDKKPFMQLVKPIHEQYKHTKVGEYVERIQQLAP